MNGQGLYTEKNRRTDGGKTDAPTAREADTKEWEEAPDMEEVSDVEEAPDMGEASDVEEAPDMEEEQSAEVCAFSVQEKDRGRRVDAWLPEQREGLTRSAAARLCEEGRVRRDGQPLPKNARLSGGETVTVEFPEPEPMEAVPQNIPLDIIYEDADVIVVNKLAGMVVHPAPGHPDGTLVNALLYHCGGSLSGIGGVLRPGIVHRIDRDTSGLIIAAKNDAAHLSLSAQLKDHTLARTYRCIVLGTLREDAGTVDAPIGRSQKDRKRMAVYPASAVPNDGRRRLKSGYVRWWLPPLDGPASAVPNDGRRRTAPPEGQTALPPGVRNAVTHWRAAERLRGHTDVECRLETGRTHQIRVHMAYLGHPVLGDPVYGKAVPGLTGQCLHAVGLRFLHPRTGEAVELSCELPGEYVEALRKLRGYA